MLSALALQFGVLALAAGMMRSSLRRRPGGGLFTALPAGLLAPLALAAVFFVQVHGGSEPEMLKLRDDWMRRWAELMVVNGVKAPSEALKAEFMALGEKVFGAMPAFYFCIQASVLAAMQPALPVC